MEGSSALIWGGWSVDDSTPGNRDHDQPDTLLSVSLRSVGETVLKQTGNLSTLRDEERAVAGREGKIKE